MKSQEVKIVDLLQDPVCTEIHLFIILTLLLNYTIFILYKKICLYFCSEQNKLINYDVNKTPESTLYRSKLKGKKQLVKNRQKVHANIIWHKHGQICNVTLLRIKCFGKEI